MIHLKVRGFESGLEPGPDLIIVDMELDNRPITGACGLRVPVDKIQGFVDRIDPDYWNGEIYIPGRPIDLTHIRIVQ